MHNDELVIPGSSKKAITLLFIAVALVAVGIFLIVLGEVWGWVMVSFFALGIPIAIWMLWPNNNYLKLDPKGLEMKALLRPMQLKWTDVDDFYIATIHGNKMIGIRYSSSYARMAIGRKVVSAISGIEGALPDHFQNSPEEICETLNRWREKFGHGI
jgi:hypothetical protein